LFALDILSVLLSTSASPRHHLHLDRIEPRHLVYNYPHAGFCPLQRCFDLCWPSPRLPLTPTNWHLTARTLHLYTPLPSTPL
jgi:hypothetical protein